jgi:hypothetical protein
MNYVTLFTVYLNPVGYFGFEIITAVAVEWAIMSCISVKVNRRFGGKYHLHLHGADAICFHASILLGLFFEPKNGGDMFLRNVGWISYDCKALYHNHSCENLKSYTVAFLTSILNVPFSNIDRGTDNPEIFRRFPQSLLSNAGIKTYVMPRPYPSALFPVHYSLTSDHSKL